MKVIITQKIPIRSWSGEISNELILTEATYLE